MIDMGGLKGVGTGPALSPPPFVVLIKAAGESSSPRLGGLVWNVVIAIGRNIIRRVAFACFVGKTALLLIHVVSSTLLAMAVNYVTTRTMKHLGAFFEVLSRIISTLGGYESEWVGVEAERRPQPIPIYPGGTLDLLFVLECVCDVSLHQHQASSTYCALTKSGRPCVPVEV